MSMAPVVNISSNYRHTRPSEVGTSDPTTRTSCSLSAAARDALREDGKEETKRRVAENNLAADDDFAGEGRWPHITEAQCRIGDDREIIRREPSVRAVFVIEDVRKNSINHAINRRQSE